MSTTQISVVESEDIHTQVANRVAKNYFIYSVETKPESFSLEGTSWSDNWDFTVCLERTEAQVPLGSYLWCSVTPANKAEVHTVCVMGAMNTPIMQILWLNMQNPWRYCFICSGFTIHGGGREQQQTLE